MRKISTSRAASCLDVSLSMKMCAQRKAGRRQRASPAVCTLPMVPCGSSPVTRFALASAMRKTKRLRRRLSLARICSNFLMNNALSSLAILQRQRKPHLHHIPFGSSTSQNGNVGVVICGTPRLFFCPVNANFLARGPKKIRQAREFGGPSVTP